jgi:hypothetical protein
MYSTYECSASSVFSVTPKCCAKAREDKTEWFMDSKMHISHAFGPRQDTVAGPVVAIKNHCEVSGNVQFLHFLFYVVHVCIEEAH